MDPVRQGPVSAGNGLRSDNPGLIWAVALVSPRTVASKARRDKERNVYSPIKLITRDAIGSIHKPLRAGLRT